MRFILHEPYDLSWRWVDGVKTFIIALFRSTFLKEKLIHRIIKFSFVFGLTDS